MLELQGVTAGYQNHVVLRDVSITVPDAAVVALLGPNGAGKSTLLRVASGVLPVESGRLLFEGEDVTGEPADALARRGICHVPEGRGVFPGLSVRDNLRLQSPNDLNPAMLGAIARVFPRLGERIDQTARTMSGGEQQMLALSHAYLAAPVVTLLDEVSMGLAPRIVDDIYGHLRRLAEGGTSMLLVEQYVGRALELADYVYVLRKGLVEFSGEPGELGQDSILASYLGSH